MGAILQEGSMAILIEVKSQFRQQCETFFTIKSYKIIQNQSNFD